MESNRALKAIERNGKAGERGAEPIFSSGEGAGRVPPHALDVEQAVLGSVLLDNESLNAALELLQPDDFYHGAHRIIFETMIGLSDALEPIDAVTLTDALRTHSNLDAVGGIEYISRLVDIVPTAANTEHYSRVIKELSLRRKLIHTAAEISNEAFETRGDIDGFIDSVEQKIFRVSESRVRPSFVRVSEVVNESIKQIEKNYSNSEPITGVATGFADFDRITSGLQGSDLIILAGRPSMGKTSLALSIARHVGMVNGGTCAVFSLEMAKQQIVMRLLCSEARVSNSKVRSGQLADNDFPRLVDAASELSKANIFIDDTPAISVLEMRAKSRRLHKEHQLDLIIVDYLQLMRSQARRHERREQEISEISASLKALAKELNVPVIALSQLNRGVEARTDKRPMMSDLRESGAIEQDADIISFVYRDEVYHPDTPDKGVAELIIGKHRNGPTGVIRLAFLNEYTLFENLAEEEEYDYLGDDLAMGAELEDDLI